MKQQSKKIIENLLSSLMAGTAEYSIIENDLKRVLFMESVSESNKFNMYAYCFKDDLCPYYNGVYHDANRGCAVYTDGKILFYSRKYFNEDLAGKCVTKDGTEIKICRYPNWFYVVENNKATKSYHERKIDCDTVDRVYKESKIWINARYPKASSFDKETHALFNIDGNYFTITKIRKISLVMRDFGFEELAISDDVEAGNPALFTSEDNGVVVMPVVPMDYENDKSYYVVQL